MAKPTPYNDTCARTYANLRIYSGELDPSLIEERIKVPATQINRKGDVRINSRGRSRVLPENAWFLSSEGHVTSMDLRHHLDWLLAKLEPSGQQLRELFLIPLAYAALGSRAEIPEGM